MLFESDVIKIYYVRYLPTTSVRQIIIECQTNKRGESVASACVTFIPELKQTTFPNIRNTEKKSKAIS
jgi:hypothetical protein